MHGATNFRPLRAPTPWPWFPRTRPKPNQNFQNHPRPPVKILNATPPRPRPFPFLLSTPRPICEIFAAGPTRTRSPVKSFSSELLDDVHTTVFVLEARKSESGSTLGGLEAVCLSIIDQNIFVWLLFEKLSDIQCTILV